MTSTKSARHRAASPRPPLGGVCVSRIIQASVDAAGAAMGHSLSEAWENAGSVYAMADLGNLTLTARGARILGKCRACGAEFQRGDRVRRDGEWALHEGCHKST